MSDYPSSLHHTAYRFVLTYALRRKLAVREMGLALRFLNASTPYNLPEFTASPLLLEVTASYREP